MTCARSCLVVACCFAALQPALAQPIPQATDVVNQFLQLKDRGDPMGFRVPVDLNLVLVAASHWQGIARHPNPETPYLYAVASRPGCATLVTIHIGTADSKSGGRLRANRLQPNMPSNLTSPPSDDQIVHTVTIDDSYGGGIQAAGDFLFIPMTGPCGGMARERIAMFDISNPAVPVFIRDLVDGDNTSVLLNTTGAVGVALMDSGKYLMATLGNNPVLRLHAFDASTEVITDSTQADMSLLPHGDFQPWPSGGNLDWGHQSIQLVNPLNDDENPNDIFETFYLICYRNTLSSGNGVNIATLYRLNVAEFTQNNEQMVYMDSIVPVAQREFQYATTPDGATVNTNFGAASSAWVSPTGTLCMYSTEYYITGQNYSVNFSEFSGLFGDYPAGVFTSGCTAQVQLSTDSDFDGKTLTVDALDYTRENYAQLANHDGAFGFANNVSSLTWNLPPGCVARLYNNANFGGDFLQLEGVGSLSDLTNVPFSTNLLLSCNNRFQSMQFLGNATPASVQFPQPGSSISTLPQIIPQLPCAMVKFTGGSYPGSTVISQPAQLSAIGSLVILGGE